MVCKVCVSTGNEVDDSTLARTFGKYPSFQKAKIVRDGRTKKPKGYGFVSFADPADFTKVFVSEVCVVERQILCVYVVCDEI
jgi:hypothetical protein